VVVVKVADTPPTVSTALVVAENCVAVVTRIVTVCPLDTVPDVEVNALPSMEYSPPVIEIGAAALMPEMVIAFELTTADWLAPFWLLNSKPLGVVSTGGGVGEPPLPPPPPPHPPSSNVSTIADKDEIRFATVPLPTLLIVIRALRS